MTMAQGRTLVQMLRDRLTKQGLYDTPSYWDMKAESYEGLARSNWPSNTYNRHWDERQMAILDNVLGDVQRPRGRRRRLRHRARFAAPGARAALA